MFYPSCPDGRSTSCNPQSDNVWDVRPLCGDKDVILPHYSQPSVEEVALGPCVNGLTTTAISIGLGLPTKYQKNPCYVRNYMIVYNQADPSWYTGFPTLDAEGQDIQISEIDEAAADMFLNWIYWVNGNLGGFQDKEWSNQEEAIDATNQLALNGKVYGAGLFRNIWMNCTVTRLFNLHGFWRNSISYSFPDIFAEDCIAFQGLTDAHQ